MKKSYAVIGLGLMGGSLAQAIRRRIPDARVIGISRSPASLRTAKTKRFIHEGTSDLRSGIQNADFIILCTPVDIISKLLRHIDRWARPGTIVTDVGSAKAEIVRRAGVLKRIHFVGSHPMAGSHRAGLAEARADLFENAFVFVTPDARTHRQSLKGVQVFWKRLKSRVVTLAPNRHDQIVSEISHLPHAVAFLLMRAASSPSLHFAASGFRDMTRIAQSDPHLWTPILLQNRKFLIPSLKSLEKQISSLRRLLQRRADHSLFRLLSQAQGKRLKLQAKTV